MFLNLYLSTLKKRIKKSKAHAMKKRTHLRAKIQRVLTMKPDSVSTVSTATSNLLTLIKSLVLDTIRITDHFRYPQLHLSLISFAFYLWVFLEFLKFVKIK